MADYWKSIGHKWCEYCKKFIKDTKVDWQRHEQGPYHKENVAKRLTDLRAQSKKSEKDAAEFQKQLKQIENAAMRQSRQDEDAVLNNSQFQQYSTYKPAQNSASSSSRPRQPEPEPEQPHPAAPTHSAAQPPASAAYTGWTPEQIAAWGPYYAQYYAQYAQYASQYPAAAYGAVPPRAPQHPKPPGPPQTTPPIETKQTEKKEEKEEVAPKKEDKKDGNPTAAGGLQWEEVTEDHLYSSAYRPASPDDDDDHNGSSNQKEKKRKRDYKEYDGIDNTGGDNDSEDDDSSRTKRLKPSGVTYSAPEDDDDDDDDGEPLVWKKRDPTIKSNIRKRTL